MTKVFGFLAGRNEAPPYLVACVLTEKGKWIAGAVSQSLANLKIYTERMAKAKAAVMVSGETSYEWKESIDFELGAALERAFASMP
jgi:hypothetical protein